MEDLLEQNAVAGNRTSFPLRGVCPINSPAHERQLEIEVRDGRGVTTRKKYQPLVSIQFRAAIPRPTNVGEFTVHGRRGIKVASASSSRSSNGQHAAEEARIQKRAVTKSASSFREPVERRP